MLDFANRTGQLKPIGEIERQQLQRVLTNMVLDIQTVCENNGITVMAAYGTALGAYRHQGFIPWDDDADLCMTRSDWEKFRDNFDELFKGDYILEAPQYGKQDTQMTWGKIYLPRTKYVEIFNENTPYNKGIFVDIFIIDYLSDNRYVRMFDTFITQSLSFAINSISYYKYQGETLKAFRASTKEVRSYFRLRRVVGFIMSIRSHKAWCDTYDRYISRHKNTKLTKIHCTDRPIPADVWLPVKKTQFVDISMNVPHSIEKYLERMYGESYMQLPPEEKREQHFCIELDFGQF